MSPTSALTALLLAASAGTNPQIPFEKYALPNGLTVILSEDHRIPQVAVDLCYHVGAANQAPGKSGFAHLFEHIMFGGAKHIGNKPLQIIEDLGGWGNAWTSDDMTSYVEVLPAERLPTALWLESDRMGWLVDALDAKAIQVQRDVVSNERRETYENKPWGLTEVRTCDLLYPRPHPYFDCVIGTIAEIQAASVDEIKAFFRRYYVPNNASLTIVGDIDPGQTKDLVARYFAPIPRGADVAPPEAEQPPLPGVHRETVSEPLAQEPGLRMLWKGVSRFSGDEAAGDVLEDILAKGKASQLYRDLVERRQIASSVWTGNPSHRLGGVFQVNAAANQGHTEAELEAAVDPVLEEVRIHGVTAEEVARVQRVIAANMLRGLERIGPNGGKAGRLTEYEVFLGDPGFLPKDLARYRAVTPAMVQAFARKYLLPDRRVILDIEPAPAKPAKTASAR